VATSRSPRGRSHIARPARADIARLAGVDDPPTARYYGEKRSGNAGGSRGVAPPGPTTAPSGPAQLRAAKRLTKRAFRQRERTFLAEGPQAVAEALRCGAQVTDLFVTVPARSRHADLVAAAEGAGVPVHVVSGEVMGDLAQTVTPQGLLAVCGFVDVPLAQVVSELKGAAPTGQYLSPRTHPRRDEGATREGGASRAPGSERENRVTQPAPLLVTLLANVRDPGNAGTVLRTADAAGVRAVVFADASVDPYNGKCVRASAGSLFHLPVVAGVRLEEAVAAMRGAGLRILAADGRAGRSLDDPDVQARLGEPTAWMFGNEAWGLPPDLVALADEPVAVPIYGQAESLNLAAAAAVCLYASARAQRVHSEGERGGAQAIRGRDRLVRK
jgi:RNA methyltransferase, TrmH family